MADGYQGIVVNKVVQIDPNGGPTSWRYHANSRSHSQAQVAVIPYGDGFGYTCSQHHKNPSKAVWTQPEWFDDMPLDDKLCCVHIHAVIIYRSRHGLPD